MYPFFRASATVPLPASPPFMMPSVLDKVVLLSMLIVCSSKLVVNAFSPCSTRVFVKSWPQEQSHPQRTTRLFQEEPPLASGRVLPPEYFKAVYEPNNNGTSSDDNGDIRNAERQRAKDDTSTTPWDIGRRPQPRIVKAYEAGQLRGRILDAGCGAGETCIYLAGKYGVTSVVGCDLAPGAIRVAEERAEEVEKNNETVHAFWTRPQFFVASCTEMATEYHKQYDPDGDQPLELFDVAVDSGLLHCLSDDVAELYVQELAQLVQPSTGRAYVGCFSSKNPAETWDNPRILSPKYLRNLFCEQNGWKVVSIEDTWWARPPQRGSSQGAFSMAFWMEACRI